MSLSYNESLNPGQLSTACAEVSSGQKQRSRKHREVPPAGRGLRCVERPCVEHLFQCLYSLSARVLTLGGACQGHTQLYFIWMRPLTKCIFHIYVALSNHIHVLRQFEKRPLMTSLVRRVLKVESPPSSVLRPGRGHLLMSTMATPRKHSGSFSEVTTPLQVIKPSNHGMVVFR